MFDVICVGVLTVDVFLRPAPRRLSPGDYVFLSDAQFHPGGTALNTAVDLARLGLKAAVIGTVGTDLAGGLLVETMRREGVDVSRLSQSRDAGTPSWYCLTAEDDQEHYYYFGGSNALLTEKDVPGSVFSESQVLHIGGAQHLPALDGEPMARLLQRARRAGCTTTLDPTENTTPENKHLLLPALPHLDFFFPNLEQALVVTETEAAESAVEKLLAAGAGTVVIKMGHRGCLIARDRERILIPAYAVDEVDPTGAGDAFIAGFLLALKEGWSLARAGRVGNAMGALTVQGVGAISTVVTRERAIAFLDEVDPDWRQA